MDRTGWLRIGDQSAAHYWLHDGDKNNGHYEAACGRRTQFKLKPHLGHGFCRACEIALDKVKDSAAALALRIDQIRRDGGTQPRAGLNEEHIARLVEALRGGESLPPVVLFFDGEHYWLADGFHRLSALVNEGRTEALCEVRQGDRRAAVLHSVGANRSHGLPRSREDMRRAIETLLRDQEWSQWSDREIARQVGCDHKTVASARERLSGEIPQIENRTVARNGTTYTQAPKANVPPPSAFADDEIAVSLRSLLFRLDCLDAQPLLDGIRDRGVRDAWARDLSRVAGIAGLALEGDYAEATAQAERIEDASLGGQLAAHFAELRDRPKPPEPGPAEELARLIRRASAVGANLKVYGEGYRLEESGASTPYANGDEEQIAERIGFLEQQAIQESRAGRGLARVPYPGVTEPADWDAWRARAHALGAELTQSIGGGYTLTRGGVVVVSVSSHDWATVTKSIVSMEQNRPRNSEPEPAPSDDSELEERMAQAIERILAALPEPHVRLLGFAFSMSDAAEAALTAPVSAVLCGLRQVALCAEIMDDNTESLVAALIDQA